MHGIDQLKQERKKAKADLDRAGEKIKKTQLIDRIKGLKADLKEKVKGPQHTPLDPNQLPFRTPKPNKRKPRLRKEEFTEFHKPIQLAFNGDLGSLLLAQASPDLPTPQDLAETIEVQFTQEINNLAASLENNPVKIYNWVRNNIEFVPTWGSIQGADHCLLTKECNAMDTASLLIALFRTSGISARYVTGTIIVPIDQVKNWAGGFTDAQSAVEFMTAGGISAAGGIIGGQIVETRMEHVWVEAYVDYIPSRGAVHKEGDTWIPLDASFKQYDFKQGVDLDAAIVFDEETFFNQITATATVNELESSATNIDGSLIETALRDITIQLGNHVDQNIPNALVGDVIGAKSIREVDLPSLSSTLPYKTLIEGATFSDVPDTLRYQLTIELVNESFFGVDFSYSAPLASIADQRITLSYVPAAQADQDVIASLLPDPHPDGSPFLPEELPASFPAYLINMKPELRIDGVLVATGSAIGMGNNQTLNISFFDPSPSGAGNDIISNNLIVGEYQAIVVNAGGISQESMEKQTERLNAVKAKIAANDLSGLSKDGLFGDMLYSVILTYFYEVDALDKLIAETMNVAHMRLPSQGAFSLSLAVSHLFGAPNSVTLKGMLMDVDRILYTVKARDGDQTMAWKFGLASGSPASALEHSVPEQLLSTTENPIEAVSAVKALSIANSQGIPIYTITPNNAATILPQLTINASAFSTINNAINAGKVVTVSKTPVNFNGRQVLGYAVLDSVSGSGAYIISGNNGAEVELVGNLILGMVWGMFALAAFTAGLLGAPLYVPLLIGLGGAVSLASIKFGLTGDSELVPHSTLIGLIWGYVKSRFVAFNLLKFTSFGLMTAFSAVNLPLFIIMALLTLGLIITDYWFALGFRFDYYRKWYA